MTLGDGMYITALLAVAADGRDSPARAAAEIRNVAAQPSAVGTGAELAHGREHGATSTEFHTRTSACSRKLPCPAGAPASSAVRPETADELAALDDAALSQRIEEKMQSMLGRVSVEPGRQIHPPLRCSPYALRAQPR